MRVGPIIPAFLLGTSLLAQVPAPLPTPAPAGTPVPVQASAPTPDARPSFTEWLQGVRQDALARGIRPEIVEQAFADVEEPLPVVLERDRSQAETVLSLETYVNRQLTRTRIARGRSIVSQFRPVLDKVAAEYGVPVRILAGVWGIESNFGGFSGTRPTIAALATLAWDPRRSALFRRELLDALEILNRGDIELRRMKGSWAGAMGQPQFMPSSYLAFAVDHDGDGQRDIWGSPGDVLASIANYLKGHGWTAGQTWGREVRLSKDVAKQVAASVGRREGTCSAKRDMTVALPLAEWDRMGVRTVAGTALPVSTLTASLVSGTSKHYLVYPNYDALLEYNCAHAYALAVAILGERIGSGTPAAVVPDRRAKPASPAAR